MEKVDIQFRINGEDVSVKVRPHETLLETLRERQELTGVKEGCGLGACGSCTVQLNGQPVRACLVLTPEVEGAHILTIEGLRQGDHLSPGTNIRPDRMPKT